MTLWRECRDSLRLPHIQVPDLEADRILNVLFGLSKVEIIKNQPFEASPESEARLREVISRRREGEPLQYLLNTQGFYGRDFYVDKRVLIPRPETEHLVEWAIQRIRSSGATSVLDLGCGSGCIGLTILAECEGVNLVAVDVSDAALAVAKENAERLGLDTRVQFKRADACGADARDEIQGMNKEFDLILANPPYISAEDTNVDKHVRAHEPHGALFSSEGGLYHLRTWLQLAGQVLSVNGAVGFEIGASQGAAAEKLFLNSGLFSKVKILRDFTGKDRVVIGVR